LLSSIHLKKESTEVGYPEVPKPEGRDGSEEAEEVIVVDTGVIEEEELASVDRLEDKNEKLELNSTLDAPVAILQERVSILKAQDASLPSRQYIESPPEDISSKSGVEFYPISNRTFKRTTINPKVKQLH